ncbi:tetraacyldisaccharide 4'-kinase [Vibrio metschnikovii]
MELLQRQGYRPGVVSRGYGGKAAQYPLLVTDRTLPTECGDEPKLIYQRTQVPQWPLTQYVRMRFKHCSAKGVDLIVTDDGLQHYALERDIEFAVVDGVRRFGNQQLLPLGPLREPVERLQQVDFVINNGGDPAYG